LACGGYGILAVTDVNVEGLDNTGFVRAGEGNLAAEMGVTGALSGDFVLGRDRTLLGGDLTAAANEEGLESVALGNTDDKAGRVFILELKVDVVNLSAIGLELGVPGGVGGTRFGDC
jgi:hypothetical protein